MQKLIEPWLLWAMIHVVGLFPTLSFQLSPVKYTRMPISSTILNGKLWDKLEIDPDPLDEEPGWYLMNCIVGSEKDLLAQAKHVTRNLPEELVEKLVVPQKRQLRSHGKTQKVVEVKVMYPGYVFCKMRICAETYELLQQLLLCRSWMAGTVNQKGYKKLPPAPIALSDDEVAKFKGLEEQTDAMYEKFGEDYTGRGDAGTDLLGQYEGYDVENMVKILEGNFKGEDGVVRRLKDGLIMVRLYTYGNVLDQWFKPSEIRPMTDAEAMKGLTGPSNPVNQDDFDLSIGKRPKRRDEGGRGLHSTSTGGGDTRMRRQDRINRGERGNKDMYGRTEQKATEEEENWRQFREEQRASQEQKKGDMWGIKERTSWDSGDDAAQFDGGKWKSGRQMRREKKQDHRGSSDSQNVQDAIDGGGEWDFFTDDSTTNKRNEKAEEDDFFSSLMSELSDTLDETPKKENKQVKQQKDNTSSQSTEDDFFTSLMSELSDTLEETPNETPKKENKKIKQTKHDDKSETQNNEDDFFTDLMSQLSESVDTENEHQNVEKSKSNSGASSDDDFFASLEADLNESLQDLSGDESPTKHQDNFFGLDDSNNSQSDEDDFFTSLENQLVEVLEDDVPKSSSSDRHDVINSKSPKNDVKSEKVDLNKLTVPILKDMLRERGLKVSGKKSDLIARLGE